MATRYTLIHSGKKLSDLSATTSLELKGVISDETGSGALVFGTAPTFTTGIGIGTYSASYMLQVDNGATTTYPINLISSSKFVRIGCLNSTYAHVDTDATQGFYFYDKVTTGSGNNEFAASTANSFVCGSGGNFGIGVTSSQGARLHIAAGTATANTAPLKFTSGTLLSAPVAGVMEFLSDSLYFTITTGAARKTIAFTDSNITGKASTAGRADSAILADGLSISGITFGYAIMNGVPDNHWQANCSVEAPTFYGALVGNVTGNCTGTSANVTGTVAVANGGTGTTTAFTTGSVVFAGASGVYSQDNTNFFYDDTNERLSVGGITSPAQRFVVGYGHQRFDTVTKPATPTTALAGAGAGNLSNGVYRWTVAYLTADGETTCSTRSVALTVVDKTTDGQVDVTYAASANPKVTNIKIYRDKVGVDYWYHLVTTVANANGTYRDNIADTSLPADRFAYGQESNTTAGKVFVDTSLAMFFGTTTVCLGITANPNITPDSTSVGKAAGYSCTTGSQMTAVGYAALYNNVSGTENTGVGYGALQAMTGSHSTGVGRQVGGTATGTGFTGVGYYAGYSQGAATYGVFLGYKAGYYETGSSKLFIDNASRTNEADGRAKALIYGVFDAAVANQKITFNVPQINISATKTPASAAATGTTGDICWDASYIYVCTATDTWKRAGIATW